MTQLSIEAGTERAAIVQFLYHVADLLGKDSFATLAQSHRLMAHQIEMGMHYPFLETKK